MKAQLVVASSVVALAFAAIAAPADKVHFRNASKETKYVVTDVGPGKARRNFRLEPEGTEAVDVGKSYLVWCSYSKPNSPVCTPSQKEVGGNDVVIK